MPKKKVSIYTGKERRRWTREDGKKVLRPGAKCNCDKKGLGVSFRGCPRHGLS